MNLKETNEFLSMVVGQMCEAKGKKLEWGFDIGHVGSAANWKKLVSEFGLKYKKVARKSPTTGRVSYRFHWQAPGLLIVTGNNPISGEYSDADYRDPEQGFTSYIGIEGEPSKVRSAVAMLKKIGRYKDESPNNRDFI